jgi:hypothetical protein
VPAHVLRHPGLTGPASTACSGQLDNDLAECAALNGLVRGSDVLQPETVHWQLSQRSFR